MNIKAADELRSLACWKSQADAIIASAPNDVNMSFDEFLTHCTPCGGNWGGMLLSGIRELWPDVWEAIPEHMGIHAFHGILTTLRICGVYLPED